MGFMVEHNGKTLGPYSRDEVPRRVEAGDLALTDMACDEHAGTGCRSPNCFWLNLSNRSRLRTRLPTSAAVFSAIGWGGILGIAYFFYRIARLMHACARVHPMQ